MSSKAIFQIALVSFSLFLVRSAQGQLTLSGTNYTQNFDAIGNGLPVGWTVRTNASGTNLGYVAYFPTAAKSWADTTGEFGNCAGTTNNLGNAATFSETSTQQSAFTNRCLAVRQVANNSSTFPGSDPGASFVFQIANTTGLSNFTFKVDLNMLRVNAGSTTWTLDYAVADSPTSFTPLGTYSDPGTPGTTTQTYSLGTDADDQPQNVWIRISALTASSGGTRDTLGIDNFVLDYAAPATPTINVEPTSRTNGVFTTASFSVVASGIPPMFYQWYKGEEALSDAGKISGSTNDTLILTQVVHTNSGDYHVIITNVLGSVTSSVVSLKVIGFAIAPLTPTNALLGTPLTMPLAFLDNETPVTSVFGSSSNQGILSDADISGSGFGDSGSATITPNGTNGVVFVSLGGSDGSFSTNTTLAVMVVPSTNVLFNDHFDYANGSVTAKSLGLWHNHSGPAGQMTVTNGALRVSRSFDEDVNALLVGQPIDTNRATALYSRFTFKLTDLPTTTGNYFAHFRDTSASGIRARIWVSTANTNAGNTCRLGIGNTQNSTATSSQFPMDLNLNTNYTIVTRLVLSNGISTLWINPATESDPGVTAGDESTNAVAVTSYAFRQDSSEGNMLVDDLFVGTTFTSVLPLTATLDLQLTGTNAVLTWSSGQFYLLSSTNVAGPYDYEPDAGNPAASPYTISTTNEQKYFRLINSAPIPPGN